MHTIYPVDRPRQKRKRSIQVAFASLLLTLLLLTSACSGDAHVQQQSSQNKTQLDALLKQAQDIGVPNALLQPILTQEQQLSSSSAPFNLFSDQPANDYYHNLAIRSQQLQVQVQGLITASTQQLQSQAQHDVQSFQILLSLRVSQKFPNLQNFSQHYTQDESLLTTAHYPKDFTAISQDAHTSITALSWMGPAFDGLNSLERTIAQMQQAHLDVTALQQQYQSDMDTFTKAKLTTDFQSLSTLIDAQYGQAVVSSIQSLPYVGAAKIQDFQAQLNLLKTYGIDASHYQQLFVADQARLQQAKTIHDYLTFSAQVDTDIISMHDDLVQGAANYLVTKLDHEANAWGQAHAYHDSYDGNNYILDSGYTLNGIGSWIQQNLSFAQTPDDFQAIVDQENNTLFNLHMLEADYADKTPYNKVHATDLQIMDHYNLHKGQVVIVSLVEEAMRVYQDGQLVTAFQVTTGRVELPSLPGLWTPLDRKSPTIFKSNEPKGSAFWYPDTPINYAILYHEGGYNIHDAPWRVSFGAGTQFPHYDASGDQAFSFNGSHGCINMAEGDAAWVYNHTDFNTPIAIY